MRYQIILSNTELLFSDIARYFNQLHPISEGTRNSVYNIGSANKENLGEVDRNIQEVVHKVGVLFRVEKFKKGGSRISVVT